MQPDYWNKATRHLSKQCPTMGGLIKRYKGESLKARGDGFYTLVRAVVGQQISVKAADAVWGRLSNAVKPLTPKTLLSKAEEALRACGLSASKVAYARNVSQFFLDHKIKDGSYWDALSDAEIIAQLTAIKGIGEWTAEMFLIFCLCRPNIFPVKDLAILKAIDLQYQTGKRLKPKEYKAIAEAWHPYRTVATWYLWRSLDPVPVEY